MDKITITLDGHSGCGKSTLAKLIAQKLNYIYVDTGAMYRAITYYFLSNKFLQNDSFVDGWESHLNSIVLSFKKHENYSNNVIYLNGECVEDKIRSMKVSSLVSYVSKQSVIRKKLVSFQRDIGKYSGVVMDGRDIGTVVFPKAEIKLWVTASAKVRAKRRYDEIVKSGLIVDFSDVLQNLRERDFEDSNRKMSPLKRPESSYLIDSSDLNIEETFNFSMEIINTYFDTKS